MAADRLHTLFLLLLLACIDEWDRCTWGLGRLCMILHTPALTTARTARYTMMMLALSGQLTQFPSSLRNNTRLCWQCCGNAV